VSFWNKPRLDAADPGIRQQALRDLATTAAVDSAKLFASVAVSDPDFGVRQLAARLIGEQGLLGGVVRLATTLRETEGETQAHAGRALGLIGPLAFEELLLLSDDASETVRREAIRALGAIGDARAAAPLVAHLDDKGCHGQVKQVTLESLRRLPSAAVLAALLPHCWEHGLEEYFLWEIDPLWPKTPEAKAAVPGLVARLSENPGAIASMLAVIGAAETVDALLPHLVDERVQSAIETLDPDWARRPAAADQIPQLLDRLAEVDPERRRIAAQRISTLADTRCEGPLLLALNDSRPSHVQSLAAREAAALALGRMGTPAALQALRSKLGVSDLTKAARAAIALHEAGPSR
jgi:HEAT repeat protein